MVLFFMHNNQTIVWGYLTSQVQGNIELSTTQPFTDDSLPKSSETKLKQYLHVLDRPLLVSHNMLQSLPSHVEGTKPHDPQRTNQEIANAYIQREDIFYRDRKVLRLIYFILVMYHLINLVDQER